MDEDTQAAPSLRDRERHRRISRNTVPSLRDAMRQSIGGPGIMGDQVKDERSKKFQWAAAMFVAKHAIFLAKDMSFFA